LAVEHRIDLANPEIDGQPAVRLAVIDAVLAGPAVDVVGLVVDRQIERVVETAAHHFVGADAVVEKRIGLGVEPDGDVIEQRAEIACHDTVSSPAPSPRPRCCPVKGRLPVSYGARCSLGNKPTGARSSRIHALGILSVPKVTTPCDRAGLASRMTTDAGSGRRSSAAEARNLLR
jgi:hypothetical protein